MSITNIIHYPKPKYCLCNKGHTLVEVYNEINNAYQWDCPRCIANLLEARSIQAQEERFEATLSGEKE